MITKKYYFGIVDSVDNQFTPYTEAGISQVIDPCLGGVLITWLNALGAWEYWLFLGNTTFGKEDEASQTGRRNTFADWPLQFANGQTLDFFTEVITRNSKTLRTTLLTKQQADALATLIDSVHSQEFQPNGQRRTVLVERGSFSIRTERDKVIELSFAVQDTAPNPSQKA